MWFFRYPCFFLLATFVCNCATADGLRVALQGRVDQVAAYLKDKGESQISVGPFTGPPELASSSGPRIAVELQELFAAQGIRVASNSSVGLRGQYELADSASGHVSIRLKASLTGRSGDILTDFSVDATVGGFEASVDKPEDVVQLSGATVHLFAEDRDEDRNLDLKKHILEPSLFTKNGRCSASEESPYSMEVLVSGKPQQIHSENGHGFVNLQRGQAYSLRLSNSSAQEAAVALSVDGLSVFTFSELRGSDNRPKYSVYIISPNTSLELKGWHRTNSEVSSFQITRYSESAASTINHTQDIGTITASFFAAWPKGGKPPEDENLTAKGDGNATGFGAPVSQKSHEVERQIGRLRSAISVRYSK